MAIGRLVRLFAGISDMLAHNIPLIIKRNISDFTKIVKNRESFTVFSEARKKCD